jgi:hypothetical protein
MTRNYNFNITVLLLDGYTAGSALTSRSSGYLSEFRLVTVLYYVYILTTVEVQSHSLLC